MQMQANQDQDMRETTLPNGIRVVTQRMPGIVTAAVAVFVDAGSRDDEEGQEGTAHFLEHMIFKGTSKRSALQISGDIEIEGGSINAMTSTDRTVFHVTGLGSIVPAALGILGDVLQDSLFLEHDIEVERQIVTQEILQRQDDPANVAYEMFMATAYPDQALGRPIPGTPESVGRLAAPQLHAFMGSRYHGGNIVVVGAGDVDHRQFLEHTIQAMGGIPASPPGLHARPVPRRMGGQVFNPGVGDQASIFLGLPTVGSGDHSAMAHHVLAEMLGGGMSAPLVQELRERMGLAYEVGAWADMSVDRGHLMLHLGTSPDMALVAVRRCHQVVEDMARDMSGEGLQRARNTIAVQYAMRQQSPMGVADHIGNSILDHGRIIDIPTRVRQAMDVTLDDVHAAASVALRGAYALAVVGPVPLADRELMLAA